MSNTPAMVPRRSSAKRQLFLRRLKAAAPAPPEEAVLRPRRREEDPALSFTQERLWFLDRFQPDTSLYNMPAVLRLAGEIDPGCLRAAAREVERRHESLRTTFPAAGGRPRQVVAAAPAVELSVIDLEGLVADRSELEARFWSDFWGRQPFDLSRGPLWRVHLYRLGASDHVLALTLHHIISDGWSLGILSRELGTIYGAFVRGEKSPLPDLPIQYADYSAWQREWLTGEVLERQLEYWRRRLGGELPILDLPVDRPRGRERSRSARQELTLPASLADQIRRRAKGGTTLFMILLAIFKILLSRLSGQRDILVGTPAAGRDRREVEGLIGCFVNTLVVRTDLGGEPTFKEVMERVRESALGAFAHREIPFEKLLLELKPERDPSRPPIFQIFFNMLNLDEARIEVPELALDTMATPAIGSKFDLTVYAAERSGGEIHQEWVFNAELFDERRIAEMRRQYLRLAEQVAESAERRVHEMTLLTAGSKPHLPDPARALDSSWHGSVAEVFAAHARRAPDRTAIVDPRETWSYGHLELRSRRLAARLRALGAGPGECVVIYAARGAALVWAVMGVLRTGAAFTILDPAYPASRLMEITRLVAPRAWLQMDSAGNLAGDLEDFVSSLADCRRLNLPSAFGPRSQDRWTEEPDTLPDADVTANSVAYVAFTSGSTGVPKGILGRHGSLSHFIPWQRSEFGLVEEDRYSLLSGLSHDPLQRDIFTPLQLGAAIVIPDPDDIGVPGRLARWLQRERVSVTHLTPALGQLLTDGVPEGQALVGMSLRYAFFVGDALKRADVDKLAAMAEGVRCINHYGSTETQRAVGFHRIPMDRADGAGPEVLPLGRGVKDAQLLVLNRAHRLAGVGEVGEIHLRSPHLALGYLADPARTAERFVPDPFSPSRGERVYKSGDLGRYDSDGIVSFAGRADRQVKIRGFRVEPGEVEALLARHDEVRAEAVVVRERPSGEACLVAYVVPQGQPDGLAGRLRDFLQSRLPRFMVPSQVEVIAELPLTATGKLDRGRLPEPAWARATDDHQPPRGPVEELVAGIFSRLLGVEQVGSGDDFFSMGGHSLLAAQLVSRVFDACAVELPLQAVFEASTVSALARKVEQLQRAGETIRAPAIERVSRSGGRALPLSFAQERLWFIQQLNPTSTAYNLPAAVRLEGPFDVAAFRLALGEVVRRHESLRTTFEMAGEEPVQVIAAAEPSPVPIVDVTFLPVPRRLAEVERWTAAEARRPFDLARGPLLRKLLIRSADEDHVVLLTMHHIISDGWSARILIRELTACYEAFKEGRSPALPELSVQYADFAAWQRRWLSGEVLESQLAYWREQLGGDLPVLSLPTDRPRKAVQSFRGGSLDMRLSPSLSEGLRAMTRRSEETTTVFMAMLASFKVLLARLSGQSDILVGVPVAGRDRAELEELIGFFPNTLVLRSDLTGNPEFSRFLARVRDTTLAAYAHREVPFEKLLIELKPGRDLSRQPVFQVFFNMLNLEENRAEHSGITMETVPAAGAVASRFDLTVYAADAPSGIQMRWVYNADLFDHERIEKAAEQFRELLETVIEAPETLLHDLVGFDLDATTTRLETGTDGERAAADTGVVFMFPGLGEQYVGMGRGLYESEPVFRQEVDRCALLLEPLLGLDLRRVLYPEADGTSRPGGSGAPRSGEIDLRALVRSGAPESSELDQTRLAQPILFVLEYALARFLLSRGTRPRAMIGFSLGEYVAACLAEVFSLEEALELVAHRARLIQQLPAGAMLAVALAPEEIEPYLGETVSVSAITGSDAVVVAGPESETRALEKTLLADGVTLRRLRTSHAFHSQMMRPIVEPFLDLFGGIRPKPPRIPFVSNLTGTWIEDGEATDPGYWAAHLSKTVRFAAGVEELLRLPGGVFLEVGPGRSLGSFVLQHPAAQADAELVVLSTIPHHLDRGSDLDQLTRTLERLGDLAAGAAGPRGQPYVAPRNPTEEIMAHLWCDLLARRRVSVRDHFFELGGHSLMAVRLVARVRDIFRVELPLQAVFTGPSLAEVAESVTRLSEAAGGEDVPELTAAPRDRPLPLSADQQRLWFLAQLHPDSAEYNMPSVVNLEGHLDVAALTSSLGEVLRRHEVLRTSFRSLEGEPVQVVDSRKEAWEEVFIPTIDLSALAREARSSRVQPLLRCVVERPFELTRSPLARWVLLRLANEDHVLVVVLHHIISDAWSRQLLIREMALLYSSFVQGLPSALPELELQYADFALWQRRWIEGERLESALAYWREQLAGRPPVLELPMDHPRPAVRTWLGRQHRFVLEESTVEELRALSRAEGLTLFMTLLAAFNLLLARYSKSNDVVVGSDLSQRDHTSLENLIGFFINMLVLRTRMAGHLRVREFLQSVRKVVLGALAHRHVPYDKLVEELRPRDGGDASLFQVIFNYNRFPPFEESAAVNLEGGLSVRPFELDSVMVRFDLMLAVNETDSGINGVWVYSTEVFEPSTIERMSDHFLNLVREMVSRPESSLQELEMRSEQERALEEEAKRDRGRSNVRKIMQVKRKAVKI